jgi:hypothetical protein
MIMKRYAFFTVMFVTFLFLVGCATNRNPTVRTDLSQEYWTNGVELNPTQWMHGASRWFVAGDPTITEMAGRVAPGSLAMSAMQVRVPNFNSIKVDGAFQVQIFGTYDHNSVCLYGPNATVRDIAVEYKNGTLYVHQLKKSPWMRNVIVRIGVQNLMTLTQLGCGTIEAIQIRSTALCIYTSPKSTGNIYLSGPVNLWRVVHRGCGSVNVFGAVTPQLDVFTSGLGDLNICGNIGVRSITHHNRNNINMIGVNTDGLKVYADGAGKIGLQGTMNIRQICARGNTCVFAYTANSASINADAYDRAVIGVSGCTQDLTVNTYGSSRFYGRFLCAQNAFVKARNWSHINVSAASKIFASASENASVYFFGTPNNLSQFISGYGVVIPIWNGMSNGCVAPSRVIYKGESYSYKGEALRVRPRYRRPQVVYVRPRPVVVQPEPQFRWSSRRVTQSIPK